MPSLLLGIPCIIPKMNVSMHRLLLAYIYFGNFYATFFGACCKLRLGQFFYSSWSGQPHNRTCFFSHALSATHKLRTKGRNGETTGLIGVNNGSELFQAYTVIQLEAEAFTDSASIATSTFLTFVSF